MNAYKDAAKTAFATRPPFVDFLQDPPRFGNQFAEDAILRECLAALLPAGVLEHWTDDLTALGARVASDGDITQLGNDAESNHPRLEQYDAWGKRVDRIHTSQGWKELHRVSATEGIVATAYERAPAQTPQWTQRVRQMAKLYLFNPSSAIYSCPLAMTDGAATLIRATLAAHDAGTRVLPRTLADRMRTAYANLTTRDPAALWTSGQWMTERPGGSDVSRTETQAVALDADRRVYALRGFKWFSSATECDMTMALARVDDDPTLSLFFVELRPEGSGELNGIEIVRLKNKLGTKALPTAELRLDGCIGHLVGERGRGVPEIARMINVTRVYNSVCAVSSMRRVLAIAHDYAGKRQVFGKLLKDQPLHFTTLRQVEVETRGNVLFAFYVASLQGRAEYPESGATAAANEFDGLTSGEAAQVLRFLTPILKLFTGKRAVAVVSEGIELIGGNGYIEETGVPRLLRDAQVLAIWEGTTNVLSLDLLRVFARSPECWATTLRTLRAFAAGNPVIEKTVADLAAYAKALLAMPQSVVEMNARALAFNVAHVTVAALLHRAGMDSAAWLDAHPLDTRVLQHKL
ncbi:hypothetical protein H9P43_003323 [Blastocladiella emersonii ATCC 22665]|nr:hypothetical protein H9P43_003275 [Blastocladiella emersonii ATCC 22665]KAI9184270.1 hypothetical protein H9P43_003323 [Blastocladiella emersonii ATCC 22665]